MAFGRPAKFKWKVCLSVAAPPLDFMGFSSSLLSSHLRLCVLSLLFLDPLAAARMLRGMGIGRATEKIISTG